MHRIAALLDAGSPLTKKEIIKNLRKLKGDMVEQINRAIRNIEQGRKRRPAARPGRKVIRPRRRR